MSVRAIRTAWSSVLAPVAALSFAVAASGASAEAGRWEIQPSPDPAGATSASLSAVSCAVDGSCMAVGRYSPNGSSEYSLAERGDGIAWTIVSTPNPAGTNDVLSGVSCPEPRSCRAVGVSVSSSRVHALAEAWNGRKWVLQSTPSPAPGSFASLNSISCTAPDSCTAVGGFTKATENAQEEPLAEHWDGTNWAIQPTPNPEAENGSALRGVSCTAPDACTAGGNYDYFDIDQKIFAMRWNGAKWMMETQRNPGGEHQNAENAVSCTSSSACTSVGSWLNLELETRPLAEGWNGAGWIRQSPSHPHGAKSTALDGVSCLSSASCATVGDWSASTQGNPTLTLAEQWNGASWKLASTPNPTGAQFSTLSGVDCPAATCVAVGDSYNGSVTQTLVERSLP
jgi:hypothetical protein